MTPKVCTAFVWARLYPGFNRVWVWDVPRQPLEEGLRNGVWHVKAMAKQVVRYQFAGCFKALSMHKSQQIPGWQRRGLLPADNVCPDSVLCCRADLPVHPAPTA